MEAVVIGLPLLLAAWACILLKWRTGVYALILFTPFTGFVVAALFPSPLGTLARDIVVVIPLYISFFLLSGQALYGRVPPLLYGAYGLLILIVLFAAVNPAIPNLTVAGIGVKVWLFYLPMVIIGAAFVRRFTDLLHVLRAFVATAWIAWSIGIIMYLGAAFYGFEATVKLFYGEYARHATQQFTAFYSYGAPLYRLPGSFQFNSQYGVFCFFMLFPIFMLLEIERSRRWRAFTWASLVVGLIAGFTSGARGNFVLMPLIFVMVQFFKFRAGGAVQAIVGMGAALFGALSIAGIDAGKIYGEAAGLTAHYGKDGVLSFGDAVDRGGLFGMGVGANTGAARHGQDAATAALIHDKGLLIESYYGKALVELGAVGFLVVLGCMVLTVFVCLQIQFRLTLRSLRGVASCCTAMAAFVILVSFKGWALDTDPMNYYFFLTLGLVLTLPYVERQWLGALSTTATDVSAAPVLGAVTAPVGRSPADMLEPALRLVQRGVRPRNVPRTVRPVIGRPLPYRDNPNRFAGGEETETFGPDIRLGPKGLRPTPEQ